MPKADIFNMRRSAHCVLAQDPNAFLAALAYAALASSSVLKLPRYLFWPGALISAMTCLVLPRPLLRPAYLARDKVPLSENVAQRISEGSPLMQCIWYFGHRPFM